MNKQKNDRCVFNGFQIFVHNFILNLFVQNTFRLWGGGGAGGGNLLGRHELYIQYVRKKNLLVEVARLCGEVQCESKWYIVKCHSKQMLKDCVLSVCTCRIHRFKRD